MDEGGFVEDDQRRRGEAADLVGTLRQSDDAGSIGEVVAAGLGVFAQTPGEDERREGFEFREQFVGLALARAADDDKSVGYGERVVKRFRASPLSFPARLWY